MNNLIYIILLLFTVHANNVPEPNVRLLPGSWLSIDGHSNVNDFKFHYSFEHYAQELELSISVKEYHLVIHPYQLSLPIRDFECSNILMRNDFRHTLKFKEQPNILIDVGSLQVEDVDVGQEGDIQTLVKIGGVEKEEKIHYRILDNRDGILNLKGKISINMADYELDFKQKFLGIIQVKPQVDITFLFNFVVVP